MKHLDLFSGIGGFALACQWAGIETIGFVEIDKYCQKVLRKHWPNVPIVEDIRDVEKIKEIAINATGEGCLAKRPETGITEQAIQETSTRQPCRTDSLSGIGRGTATMPKQPALLVTAGFPCQPFSVAGKRQGEGDDRYLWPETLAVIEAIKPKWVLLENVTGIINLALDTVLSDLEGAGYSYETLIIPACAVNAWHRRDRIWIIAYSGHLQHRGRDTLRCAVCEDDRPQRTDTGSGESGQGQAGERTQHDTSDGSAEVPIADTPSNGSEAGISGQNEGQERHSGEFINNSQEASIDPEGNGIQGGGPVIDSPISRDWWAVEPELGRVAHGIPNRVDRLKCLGNAIVPQVAYEIIKVIKEVEDG